MSSAKYKPSTAIREYLLEGNRTSRLESLLLFGVQNLTAELTQIKRDGFIVKSEKVPMAKIIRRINEYTVCKVPENLPYKEITMLEYWINR